MEDSEKSNLCKDIDLNITDEVNITLRPDEKRKKRKMLRKQLEFFLTAGILICLSYLIFTKHVEVTNQLNATTINQDFKHCLYNKSGDIFPVINSTINFPDKSIFFHETSCSGSLKERQACAVESAAVTHPNWQINVLFAASSADNYNVLMKRLLKYPNIKYYRVHIEDFAKYTPLEDLVNSDALKYSGYHTAHTADALRFITLYKWSGLCLDLDLVMVKSTESLAKNYVGNKESGRVGAGVLSLSRNPVGRFVAYHCARELSMYSDKDVSSFGPDIVVKVLFTLCKVTNLADINSTSCPDFAVYPPTIFYPIHHTEFHQIFKYQNGYISFKNNYAFHLSSKFTADDFIEKDSMYDRLTKLFCPVVYNYRNEQDSYDSDDYLSA